MNFETQEKFSTINFFNGILSHRLNNEMGLAGFGGFVKLLLAVAAFP